MPRFPLSPLALVLLLCGCAGSHKPAEAPDFTEKGWSDPSPELTGAKTDRPIQAEGASTDATSASPTPAEPAAAPAPAPPAEKPAATSSFEAAVAAGEALPPPPPSKATTKATKGHKTKKGKAKKPAKAN